MPLLQEVNAEYPFEPDRSAAIFAFMHLRIVRLDQRAQLRAQHDLFHRHQGHITTCRLAMLLETVALIHCPRECPLLHNLASRHALAFQAKLR